jgi:hypothetical protein
MDERQVTEIEQILADEAPFCGIIEMPMPLEIIAPVNTDCWGNEFQIRSRPVPHPDPDPSMTILYGIRPHSGPGRDESLPRNL